jgi:hypothetical protein
VLGKSKKDGNSMVDVKKYLSTPDQPVSMEEFKQFWESLTEEEKDEFRKTDLK